MLPEESPVFRRSPQHGRSGTAILKGIGALALLSLATGPASLPAQLPAQNGFYSPADQNLPPGVAGQWAAAAGRAVPPYFQPVKVVLPSGGKVAFFSRAEIKPLELDAPAGASVLVGATYRLRLSDMPEFPGVELYPTIELLDRLHPPAGRADEFPIPIEFTQEEIELALEGRLVTKVVYLEQPQRVLPHALRAPGSIRTVPPSRNLLAEADREGRPMVLVRIGSRAPDASGDDRAFFGPGAPVKAMRQPASPDAGGSTE